MSYEDGDTNKKPELMEDICELIYNCVLLNSDGYCEVSD